MNLVSEVQMYEVNALKSVVMALVWAALTLLIIAFIIYHFTKGSKKHKEETIKGLWPLWFMLGAVLGCLFAGITTSRYHDLLDTWEYVVAFDHDIDSGQIVEINKIGKVVDIWVADGNDELPKQLSESYICCRFQCTPEEYESIEREFNMGG